jgi:hypothetical protein
MLKYATNNDYIIEEHIALIAELSNGNRIELKRISWRKKPAKLDLREWYWKDGELLPGKGFAISDHEAAHLRDALVKRDELPRPGVDYMTLARASVAAGAAERE